VILNGVYSIIIIERGKNCKNALGDLLSQRVLNFLQRFCSEKPRALRIQALHSLTEPPVPPKAGAFKGKPP
jgi:hypothetical protein